MNIEYYNDTLCIEGGWLFHNGIMSESNYKRLTQRNIMRVMRRGCVNTPSLVAWESIPDRFKKIIIEQFGNPREIIRISPIKKAASPDKEAREFFNSYLSSDGRYLPLEKQEEYYNNAVALNAIGKIINDKQSLRKALGGRKKEI